ncbi:MAG: aminotransferase class I/II-fold pyridoxal phosphate-dependent enzyme [Kineothrix sp.]|nr:histidinol-phosphate transaminase [Lachnospiraceae bacterium 28-4]MCI8846791.1 aminotransferase class I/II-fold pyridoxal phosphate-dependent enzyme [Lachnospiraceae bacterium]MCX4342272.1 aminotransferase class I/II-fold pyridoxal phosphate-dependent enzyme [Kineothrix sp.]
MKKSDFDRLVKKWKEGTASAQEEESLLPYKADNAIIMAAGYSARCMPLSGVMPKGLFRIKGEIMIEREIEQLIAAGITEIVVITGFMAEKFQYLKDKYHVILVNNPDFHQYNNISSLYAAQKYMRNSYILCSDNYYEENIFQLYHYDSHYSCIYSEKYCDEYFVTETDPDGYITGIQRGGAGGWFTIGDAYFTENYSKKFVSLMNRDWAEEHTRNLLMDDFQIRYLDSLKMVKIERPGRSVMEFDTLEEIRQFDPEFDRFYYEHIDRNNAVIEIFTKYSGIQSYHSVPTEQLGGRLHLNENLFKPSPRCLEALRTMEMEDLYLYDLRRNDELMDVLSSSLEISASHIFIHNGSAEVIKSIFSILLRENDTVFIPEPGWSYYKSVADAKFAKCISYRVEEKGDAYRYSIEDLMDKAKRYHPRVIVITSPQMPTGCTIADEEIEKIIKSHPESVIMLDEAYWGYGDDSNRFEREMITKYSNVVITRTFSKFYGLANIRIGYGLCSYPLRRTIGLDLPLFRASGISRKIAIEAVRDTAYYRKMRELTNEIREWFTAELNAIEGVHAFQSASNFVFVRLENTDAEKVKAYMEENNILVRLFTDRDVLHLRITIAPKDIMKRVLFHLKHAIADSRGGKER